MSGPINITMSYLLDHVLLIKKMVSLLITLKVTYYQYVVSHSSSSVSKVPQLSVDQKTLDPAFIIVPYRVAVLCADS